MAKLPIATFAMAHPSELSQVKRQNQLISYHMVYYLLKEDSIRLNGYSNGNGHSNHMKTLMANDKGFKDAISTLETSCIDLKVKHLRELEELVKELDISDSKLYSDYRESCDRLMDDDVRWGRITVLFFFTSILAKRLYTEGKTNKIQSLVGWQTQFLDDVAAQWILERGGWGAIKGAITPAKSASVSSSQKTDGQTKWLLAAVGVGAAIVGALAMR